MIRTIKDITLTFSFLSSVKRMFSGLRSQWITPIFLRKANDVSSWMDILLKKSFLSPLKLSLLMYLYKFMPNNSNTRTMCFLNWKLSMILTTPYLSVGSFTFNYSRIFTSTAALSTSNFLFLLILTATSFPPSFKSKHLTTWPNAPLSTTSLTKYLYPIYSPTLTL